MMESKLTVTVARSTSELETFRGLWQQWQTHPDNDIDNFLLLMKSRKDIRRPHVTLFSRGPQPVALVVCRVEQRRVNFRMGYKTIPGPAVTSLTVPYGGILGQCDDETGSLLLRTLRDELKRESADRIEFHQLPEGSPVLDAFDSAKGAVLRRVRDDWTPHWRTSLSSDMDSFWATRSKNHRRFLRRMSNNLEREHPGKVQFSVVTEESQVQKMCEDIEEVARLTYLRGMAKGFIADDLHVGRLVHSARHGRLRAFLLSVDGKLRSYWVGSIYNGVFYAAYTGYDPAFAHFDVGQLLLLRSIEFLAREGHQHVDFGLGTALYKERFGDTCWQERTVSFYAPGLKGATLVAALNLMAGGTKVVRRCLDKLGMEKLLKRYWRRRLAQAQSTNPVGKPDGPGSEN